MSSSGTQTNKDMRWDCRTDQLCAVFSSCYLCVLRVTLLLSPFAGGGEALRAGRVQRRQGEHERPWGCSCGSVRPKRNVSGRHSNNPLLNASHVDVPPDRTLEGWSILLASNFGIFIPVVIRNNCFWISSNRLQGT